MIVSRRENKKYRALHRAQDIRRRLGGTANMMEPSPEKPKGMPWSTYERLWWEHHEAEMEQLMGMREWLDRVEKKARLPCSRGLFGSFGERQWKQEGDHH